MNERNQPRTPHDTGPSTIRVEATGDGVEAAAIQADIERTRARMSDTVEQLGERLNPDRLKDQVRDNLHDATIGKAEKMARSAADRVDRTRHSIMDNLRDNPIPTAMVGLGLGWLFVNSRRDDDDHMYLGDRDRYGRSPMGPYQPLYDDGESLRRARMRYPEGESGADGIAGRASEMGENVRDRAEEMTTSARDRAEEIADRARDRVTDIAYEARDTAENIGERAHDIYDSGRTRAHAMAADARRATHRVEDRFEHLLHDTPLAVGAAAAALGLAIGLSAPPTRREAELMGDTRDRLIDRARERAEEFGGRAQNVASRVADEARDTLEEAVEEEGMR